ncbi:MAG: HigA family addiction module antidote protein [Fimbriimonas ginsengisoli]|uniref:HigA family addiction module antidote protein n=1 Tax=Fimbriimonas ginsengisoli TaxID=1005039 RepID=A0A931LTD5_FIMGI|nr:HigA family addiction module antidote protein [Fimbriimonas ginsengisoli]
MKNELRPARVMHPGFELAHEIKARGWTQEEFALIIGRPYGAVNEIVNGKKAITPETAIQIGAALQTSAEVWLGMEADYRLWLAEQKVGGSVSAIAARARQAEHRRPKAS